MNQNGCVRKEKMMRVWDRKERWRKKTDVRDERKKDWEKDQREKARLQVHEIEWRKKSRKGAREEWDRVSPSPGLLSDVLTIAWQQQQKLLWVCSSTTLWGRAATTGRAAPIACLWHEQLIHFQYISILMNLDVTRQLQENRLNCKESC